MFKTLLMICVVCLAAKLGQAFPGTTDTYQHSLVLTPDEFAIYWNVTSDSNLLLEIHCATKQWLGFGLSVDETQNDGDVFIMWANGDGTGHFSDRHRKNGGDLVIDKKQKWFIDDVRYTGDNTFVIIKVHRKIKVCDTNMEGLDIQPGLNNIVFNYGSNFAADYVKPWRMQLVNILKGAAQGECEADPTPVVYEFNPTGYYSNQADLIDGVFRFYWNFTETDIIGEIHCKTKGWVGFGLSPNGNMDKSDVVIGWISDDGQVHFTDRHIDGRKVLVDDSQDWNLLSSKEENGFTIFKFTRKIVSCDPQDRIIEAGSPHVIYAYGTADPKPGEDIGYHGDKNRGTRQLLLISGSKNKEIVVDQVETMDFLVENVILPAADTIYYCQLMTVPDSFTQKRHIFKWELLMPKLNVERMHHVLVYECEESMVINGNPHGMCYNNPNKNRCNTISFGWAVGAEYTHFFPEDTGYPIGGDTNYKYFYVEVHYDNPQMKLGYIDSMGLRFHMTQQLRKHELGILTLGTGTNEYAISIPPDVERFEVDTYCFKNCSQQFSNNITVILATPHTHLAGNGLYTKIIRNGHDIGFLHQNKYYDFNFQNVYRLDPPVVLQPGDELITKCVFNTKGRNRFTFGGEPTYQEMCYYFYTYYPRKDGLPNCLSFYDQNSLVNLFKDLAKENYTTISEQANFDQGLLVWQGFQQLKQKTSATPEALKVYEKFLNTSTFANVCNNRYYATSFQPVVPLSHHEEPDICKDYTTTTTTTTTKVQVAVTTTSASTTLRIPGAIVLALGVILAIFI